ncbi:hypothetical protein RI367_002487 [Sorochytrium milnesiophthora]
MTLLRVPTVARVRSIAGRSHYSSQPAPPSGGILSSLLHGSDAVKRLEQDTYSRLLSRGNQVTEIAFHRVRPDRVHDYIDICRSRLLPFLSHHQSVQHVGSFWTTVGEQDTFVHITTYPSYTDFAKHGLPNLTSFPTRNKTAAQPSATQTHALREFVSAATPLLNQRTNQICLSFAFWESVILDEHKRGVYELRTYNLKPGSLLEWVEHWRKGLAVRKQFCQPVGAWFSQLGNLQSVHHLWWYPDLESRKSQREDAWKVKGWADTVYNTVRLVDNMHARVMLRIPLEEEQPQQQQQQQQQ